MDITFNKRPVKSGAGKIIVLLWIIVLCLLTLPLHFIKWLIDGKGYYTRYPKRAYNPSTFACTVSLLVTFGLVLLLVL